MWTRICMKTIDRNPAANGEYSWCFQPLSERSSEEKGFQESVEV